MRALPMILQMPVAPEARRLRLGVAVATKGRAAVVARLVSLLAEQTRVADAVLVCAPAPEDMEGLVSRDPALRCLIGPNGLPHQRNYLMEAANDLDILVFLDDDFVPARNYLEETEAIFLGHPDVVMTTGKVLADGAKGIAVSFDQASELLASPVDKPSRRLSEVYNGYGCNMAVRLEPIRDCGLTFDETLPLYAWLEDVDFSRRIAELGRIARAEWAHGVHLGVSGGRQSGQKLGYSQVANPIYLMGKGTCSWKKGLNHIARNVAANLYGAARGERVPDRSGRLYGNACALADLFRRRLTPIRALEF
ncbi:glycosyltransferase family 2 protein (plasmid) [Aliirhizobium terrae]|uniref:glycosyltransferase family 2 protein n=1 Tax=Terrirhizobium terrae TaxID=2926709 RepID=UPI0025763914|nr:glycosyltransferase family 2 protein [Rhizobium sp. CC-CFT758]WJH38085.1 glycosyltransferase family 2 protein [Rhizobium sp. CC-CFT758]